MNDIDRYLDQACRQITGPDSLRAHLRKELKEHLEEATRALIAEGMSTEDATAKAIEDLGDPEAIRDGMESVYSPGVTSLFVEQAIKWNGRRWHLAAQIGLVLIIVLAFLFVAFAMVYIVPKLHHEYQKLGQDLLDLLQAPVHISVFVVNYWYLCLIAIAAAVGFFEWMCKSENKRSIRTFILVGSSLLTVAAALWTAFAIVVAFAIMPA